MVATKYIRPSTLGARPSGASTAGVSGSYATDSLLQQAAALVLRAPELTVVFAERAASLAEAAGSDELWVRAEALAVAGRVRLGLRADTVGRAVAALRAAEDLDDPAIAAGLRTDLALCARSAGVPLMGLAAVRPVLAIEGFAGVGKAAALCQLVGCLSQFGRKPELDKTLAEADRLSGADDALDGDDRLLARALVRVAMSAHRRRHADVLGAGDAARTGLGLLDQLDDPSCDGGVVRVRLILQLVCSLLDRGEAENARDIAETLLAEPARGASVAPLGWLRMAVATRILLPSGAVEAAGVMLRDAVYTTERHGLHSLNSRLWSELAHVEQRLGRETEAIECLHQSRAAEHVHARSRRQAMGLLAGEFGHGGHAAVDLDEILGSFTGGAAAPAVVRETAAAEGSAATRHGRRAAEVAGALEVSRSVALSPMRVEASADKPAVVASRSFHENSGVAQRDAAKSAEGAPRGKLETVQADRTPVAEPPLAPPPAAEPPARVASTADGNGGVPPRVNGHAARKDPAAEVGEPAERVEALSAEPAAEPSAEALSAQTSSRAEALSDQPATPAGGSAAPAGRAQDGSASRAGEAVVAPEEAVDERPRRKTRHDSEHGSVAARSVLDRLGISAGSGGGGGRRRAADESGAPTPAVNGTNGYPHTSHAVNGRRAKKDPEESNVESPVERAGAVAGTPASNADTVAGSPSSQAGAGSPAASHADAATGSPVSRADAGGESPGSRVDEATDAPASQAGEAADSPASRADEAAGPHVDAVGDSPASRADAVVEEPRAYAEPAAEPASSEAVASAAEPASSEAVASAAGASPEPAPEQPLVVDDPWLPRLRLPPSLEPFEDFSDDSTSTSGTQFTNTPFIEDDDFGDSFPREYKGAPPLDEELPPDAGLADLLARALAEHQAGTTSAAALVKRLGSHTPDERRTVNGHNHANGETPTNGRHRGSRDH